MLWKCYVFQCLQIRLHIYAGEWQKQSTRLQGFLKCAYNSLSRVRCDTISSRNSPRRPQQRRSLVSGCVHQTVAATVCNRRQDG